MAERRDDGRPHGSRVIRSWLTLAVALSVVGLAGWSDEGVSSEPSARPALALERITNDAQVQTPAVLLLPDAAESKTILLGYDILLSRCVQDAGAPSGISESDRPAWIVGFTQPFAGPQPLGPVNPRRMAQYGFHDPVANPYAGGPVAASGAATPGSILRMCDAQVALELGGKPPVDLRPLIIEAGKLAGADPRRDGPRNAWVSCMAGRGYSYRGDGDPIAEFARNSMQNSTGVSLDSWGRTVSAREIAVANAVAACQQESRNIDTQVALLTAYETQALEQHPALVDQYQHYLDELLVKAGEAVAQRPAPSSQVR